MAPRTPAPGHNIVGSDANGLVATSGRRDGGGGFTLRSVTTRDIWDEVLIGAAIAGGVGAVATASSVIYAALQFRRRPEVRISWAVGGTLWPHGEAKQLAPGETLDVRVAVRNIGNATGETTITNIIAADCFQLTNNKGEPGADSGNEIAGRHTGGRVTYLSVQPRFFAAMTLIQDFTLALPSVSMTPSDVCHEIVFVIEDDRFSTGHRWRLPSRVRPLDEHKETAMEWRRIAPMQGEVFSGPGYRRSTRVVRTTRDARGQRSDAP